MLISRRVIRLIELLAIFAIEPVRWLEYVGFITLLGLFVITGPDVGLIVLA